MSKSLGILRASRRFTLLLGVAVLLVLGVLVSRPPSAQAAVLKKQSCMFYTDATLSVYSGYQVYNCNGAVVQTVGTVTAFKVCSSDYCCGSVWC